MPSFSLPTQKYSQCFAILKHLKVIGIFPFTFQDVLVGSNPIGKRLSPRPLNYSGFMEEEIQYSKLQRGVSRKQEQATKEATCPSQSSWLSEQKEFPSALQIPGSTATQYRRARPEGATATLGTSSTGWRNPDLTRGHVHQGCFGGTVSWVAHM